MDHKNYFEAYAEAQKLRKDHSGSDVIVRVIESPYGGYRVSVTPVTLNLDLMGNGILNGRSKQSATRYS
jgi:hypothetical protein